MEVILRQSIDKLGHPGDIVKVSPGFARNYLLPRGLAYAATPGNRKRIQQEKDRLESAETQRRGAASEVAARLEQVSLTFSARVGEEGKLFGSVTAADVAEAVSSRAGVPIDRKDVYLDEPIRSVGSHEVPVKLHSDVEFRLVVEVAPQ